MTGTLQVLVQMSHSYANSIWTVHEESHAPDQCLQHAKPCAFGISCFFPMAERQRFRSNTAVLPSSFELMMIELDEDKTTEIIHEHAHTSEPMKWKDRNNNKHERE